MANSRYQYVRGFEAHATLLKNTWVVVRVDGRGFHRFTDTHHYQKPNDLRGVQLMNKCAQRLMGEFGDIVMAYGQSDEYSFVLKPSSTLYSRRSDKIQTNLVATFAATFVFHWREFFPDEPLQYPPSFDARCVCYPCELNIKDYLRWRYVDCHINNLFNTTFWALVLRGGMTTQQAKEKLDGTLSADKNEILFNTYGINYSKEPAVFRRGNFFARVRRDAPKCDEDGAPVAPAAPAAGDGDAVAAGGANETGSSGAGAGAGAGCSGSAATAQRRVGVEDGEDAAARPTPAKRAKWDKKRAAKLARKAARSLEVRLLHVDLVPETVWELYPELLAR